MRILVTGGTGFLGRALVDRLLEDGGLGSDCAPMTELVLFTRRPGELPVDPRIRVVKGDIREPDARREALAAGVDCVFHLAAILGAQTEQGRNDALAVNIDASLAFLNELRNKARPPRVIYASSIGVYGSATRADHIDDETMPRPAITYGTAKLMNELYIADLSRNGEIDGISLRLPACLPRPRQPDATPSPDLASSVFHALKAGDDFTMPVEPDAAMWFLSLRSFIDNLMHVARLPSTAYAEHPVLQMPAMHLTVGELVDGILEELGPDAPGRVKWAPLPGLKEMIAAFPPLSTPAADALGLFHDGDRATLVRRTLASIGAEGPHAGTTKSAR